MLVMHMKLYNIHTVHERLLTENHLVYVNVSNYANIKVEKNSKSIFTKAWYLSRKFGFGMKIHIYLIIMLFCIEFSSIHSKKWKGRRQQGMLFFLDYLIMTYLIYRHFKYFYKLTFADVGFVIV